MIKKKTGAYYTPIEISNFMVRYIFKKIKDKNISVLEPSVGDGIFVESLIVNGISKFKEKKITILDINQEELLKAKNKLDKFNKFDKKIILHNDFLRFQKEINKKYSLIIGNPPYIKKKLLSEETIALCEEIHKNAKLSSKKINNIWTSFIAAGIKLLKSNGILAFVLPADILQVKYAEEIRKLLEDSFKRIEIFTLKISDFPEIEQQTIILIAYKKAQKKGTFFYKIKDIKKDKVTEISSNGLMISQTKWTHYNLSYDEISLLNKIRLNIPKLSDFVDVRAGIVTGANKFFIQKEEMVNDFELNNFVLPIIQKSNYINKKIDFEKKDFDKLNREEKSVFLLSLKDDSLLNKKNLEYLNFGIKQNINKRYKCSLRNKWYCVPNISKPPSAFFFKRCYNHPKVIKNTAGVYVADTAYKIEPKNNSDIYSFIYSFYNIITLIYAELLGRKYGKGVLELTPNEFKDLPIFYKKIDYSIYKNFGKIVNNCDDIFEILNLKSEVFPNNNRITTKAEMLQLKNIYKKLISIRISQ